MKTNQKINCPNCWGFQEYEENQQTNLIENSNKQ